MRKGFLAALALLALVRGQGTLPGALPAPPLSALPAATAVLPAPPLMAAGQALPAHRPSADQAPAAAVRARWPAALAPTPLEVPLRALAPARAGEFTLLGMH